MDFTPEDIEAVQACLTGIDRNVPVTVEPAAAVLPDAEYHAHGRRHSCPAGVACRTAPIDVRTLATRLRGQDRADTLIQRSAARQIASASALWGARSAATPSRLMHRRFR